MVAVILGQTAFAQSLPMETSQSIGIIDFVIKKSKYEETSCDAHSCQMKSVEGGMNLKLTHATMKQDRAENLHYLLQVSVKGTLFSTKVEVHYRTIRTFRLLKQESVSTKSTVRTRPSIVFCEVGFSSSKIRPVQKADPFTNF